MKDILFIFSLLFSILSFSKDDDSSDFFKIDTFDVNVFKGTEFASVKIDYYHTDGYSTHDRYWYEVIVLDSLLVLNFHSPQNDDWNYINYQKQEILDDSVREDLMLLIDTLSLSQKIKGVPMPTFTGYGADRLYIDAGKIKIAGGTVYSFIDSDEPDLDMENISSTIGGNYDALFEKLTGLFKGLDFLMEDKNAYESENDK